MVERLGADAQFGCEPTFHGTGGGTYAVVEELLTPGSVVYSFGVGADVTFETSLIESYGCRVWAFDPTAESAAHVASLETVSGLEFHQFGLGSCDESRTLNTIKPRSPNYRPATILDVDRGHGDQVIMLRSLDSLRTEFGHDDTLDLVKIDAEGAEYEFLESQGSDGPACRQIALEFHPDLASLDVASTLLDPAGWERTEAAIVGLLRAGFRIAHVSDRGTEFTFVRPPSDS